MTPLRVGDALHVEGDPADVCVVTVVDRVEGAPSSAEVRFADGAHDACYWTTPTPAGVEMGVAAAEAAAREGATLAWRLDTGPALVRVEPEGSDE